MKTSLPLLPATTLESVSYTHLDVYKRQNLFAINSELFCGKEAKTISKAVVKLQEEVVTLLAIIPTVLVVLALMGKFVGSGTFTPFS